MNRARIEPRIQITDPRIRQMAHSVFDTDRAPCGYVYLDSASARRQKVKLSRIRYRHLLIEIERAARYRQVRLDTVSRRHKQLEPYWNDPSAIGIVAAAPWTRYS